MKDEIWKPIPGYEGRYEISNLGRVKTLISNGRILKPIIIHGGYAVVALGFSKQRRIHRLVLLAFVGPCPNGYEGAHLDGNAGNNRLDNLKWCSRTENESHKDIHGTRPRGSMCKNAKLTEDIALAIQELYSFGAKRRHIAEFFGLNDRTVQNVVYGLRWQHVGIVTHHQGNKKDKCQHGHSLTGDNVVMWGNSGKKRCRTCATEYCRARRKKERLVVCPV